MCNVYVELDYTRVCLIVCLPICALQLVHALCTMYVHTRVVPMSCIYFMLHVTVASCYAALVGYEDEN